MFLVRMVFPVMHPEGRRFVGVFLLVSLVLFWLWAPLGWMGLGLTLWCYYFFRDPVRSVPQRGDLLVSPADGTVSLIEELRPPEELDLGDAPRIRVSIFMSVFNCHVNRSPCAGTLRRMVYRKGKFLSASLDKASEENERNSLVIDMPDGRAIGVVQIAGLVARRIVPFVSEGQGLRRGERFGLIRFGSRLDVYLPPEIAPRVTLGQTMVAGETVLANLADMGPAQEARPE